MQRRGASWRRRPLIRCYTRLSKSESLRAVPKGRRRLLPCRLRRVHYDGYNKWNALSFPSTERERHVWKRLRGRSTQGVSICPSELLCRRVLLHFPSPMGLARQEAMGGIANSCRAANTNGASQPDGIGKGRRGETSRESHIVIMKCIPAAQPLGPQHT